jgi:hypothetical protein
MDDLFRFLLLRPADLPAPAELNVLEADFLSGGVGLQQVRDGGNDPRDDARRFLASGQALRGVDDLGYPATALAVQDGLGAGPATAAQLAAIVAKTTSDTIDTIVSSTVFHDDQRRLADTLVALKLLSGVSGYDARGLAAAAQGYDALAAAGHGADPVRLRPLVLADDVSPVRTARPGPSSASDKPPAVPARSAAPEVAPAGAPDDTVDRIDAAIAALQGLSAAHFADGVQVSEVIRGAGEGEHEDEPLASSRTHIDQPWRLSDDTIRALAAPVRGTLVGLGLDPASAGLPALLAGLNDARNRALSDRLTVPKPSYVAAVGNAWLPVDDDGGWVGDPGLPVPTGHGSIRPVGVGDLLLVKQHVLRYEGGELAHVENVLKSEHLSRETRRLDRTETTVLTESETTKEEERDSQSTDRFSLKREANETLKQESEFKAGVAVDAKYGPFVEVKANADYGTKSSSEESTRQATEFSKDVVARSVSKVVERVLERRTVTTLTEFEEKYAHGFDNSTGTGNISGVYQWVDKVLQAQVYNYGKRLLFDITLPEPATAFIVAQTRNKAESSTLVKPEPFTLRADELDESNYTRYALQYDVTGVEAPPPPVKTVSKAIDAVVTQDPYESSKSQDLAIDEGFRAKYVLLQGDARFYTDASWRLMLGSNWIDALGTQGYADMAGEVGSVSIASLAYKVRGYAATIEIFCERTQRAFQAWQLKTHDAITGGYLAQLQKYESKLAEAAAAGGVVVSGRNPLWNQRLVTTELRKQCLTLLTAQQFEAFGALETSGEGYPQPNLERSEAQMPYIRFFEQAFEWEHLGYFFYPYFWGWKPGWKNRMLLDDVDPQFADFLRAGAGRVVFPVRPGFEAAVVHYLETGEIWNGGPPPDISSSMYVPLVKEIQEAQGAPGNEVAQGDPWLVRLPTTLAKLRPDDKLPKWKKVGEDWQPDE